jgi:tRNA A37 N6-isopentenylltransferase MiaA
MKNVKKMEEETIQRVATNTISYAKKQAKKEWFDDDCAKVNEEKNAARERVTQIKTRGAKNAHKLPEQKRGVCLDFNQD